MELPLRKTEVHEVAVNKSAIVSLEAAVGPYPCLRVLNWPLAVLLAAAKREGDNVRVRPHHPMRDHSGSLGSLSVIYSKLFFALTTNL
jgi:hypothetical protein